MSSVRKGVIVSRYKVMEVNWLEFYCLSCVLLGSVRLCVVPALEGHLTKWTSNPITSSTVYPYPMLDRFCHVHTRQGDTIASFQSCLLRRWLHI